MYLQQQLYFYFTIIQYIDTRCNKHATILTVFSLKTLASLIFELSLHCQRFVTIDGIL